jgi:hypothetical protein
VGEYRIWQDRIQLRDVPGRVLSEEGEVLLWWGVLDELNALLNVALEALDASLEELLLLIGHAAENVDGLLRAVGL